VTKVEYCLELVFASSILFTLERMAWSTANFFVWSGQETMNTQLKPANLLKIPSMAFRHFVESPFDSPHRQTNGFGYTLEAPPRVV